MMDINKYIDHTLLKQDSMHRDIDKLIEEAEENDFYAICVNPCYVEYCRKKLQGSDVRIASVIGFPLGAGTVESKICEAENAVMNGADEIDMVMNIGRLKEGGNEYVISEIKAVKDAIKDRVLKVIVETCLLNHEEKESALECCIKGGADFIKTSTGFSTGGAQIDDVKLFKDKGNGKIKIKASGGIRDFNKARDMINAGADRIGTSSSVKIVRGE